MFISQLFIFAGAVLTLYPPRGSGCDDSDQFDGSQWATRYLIGYFFVILGQGLFEFFSSNLFKSLSYSLIKWEHSADARVSNPFYSTLFLRVIPLIGLAIGAFTGSFYVFPNIGCSYFVLFITLPMCLSVIFTLASTPFLSPIQSDPTQTKHSSSATPPSQSIPTHSPSAGSGSSSVTTSSAQSVPTPIQIIDGTPQDSSGSRSSVEANGSDSMPYEDADPMYVDVNGHMYVNSEYFGQEYGAAGSEERVVDEKDWLYTW